MAERPLSARSTAMRAVAGPRLSARLGAWLDRQSPWRLRGMALLLGAAAAAAMPPIYALPALVFGFSGLVLLVDRTPRLIAAIGLGWCFAFGYFVAGIYWVANALLAVSSEFGWFLPFAIAGAVGLLSALLAVFPALAIGLARALWPAGPARLLVLAICWTIFEWLRGWVLTGFPWNPVGSSWAFSSAMIQFAAAFGVWGLSLVTVAVGALPALLMDWTGRRSTEENQSVRARGAMAWCAGGALLLLAIWSGGLLRLAATEDRTVPDVRLRLVQGNINPAEKGAADSRDSILERQLRLSVDAPGFETITHTVWAETANPFPFERFPDKRMSTAAAAPANGLLITGVLRTEPPSGPPREIWNSMGAVTRSGEVVATYDKFHLVPFGEYVPLHRLMPFISKFTPGIADFSAGPGPRTLRLPGLPPVGPLICYEVIFPGQVVDRDDRPQWLLNITNDGWYGISTGPYQHFVSARLRAVEEGLPLVRAANTGISGVIDSYGRVLAQTRLGEATVLDTALPQAPQERTPYARWGDLTTAALLILLSLFAVAIRPRN